MFTRQDLAIQRNFTQVLLYAMGFNRNMPLAVVFWPAYLEGVGLRHPGEIEEFSVRFFVAFHASTYVTQQVSSIVLSPLRPSRF
jgi:hypothetical protein